MKPTRKQMIWTIIDAIQHGRYPKKTLEDDDAILSYYIINDNDEVCRWEDEFDYIEGYSPYWVWFVAGSANDPVNVPLSWLTYDSLKKLYEIYK